MASTASSKYRLVAPGEDHHGSVTVMWDPSRVIVVGRRFDRVLTLQLDLQPQQADLLGQRASALLEPPIS